VCLLLESRNRIYKNICNKSARIFSTKGNWRRLVKPGLQILNFFVPWGILPSTIINVPSSTAGWYRMKLRRDIKSLWQELELQSSMREVWSQNPKANEVFEAKRALEDGFTSFHLLRSLRMFFFSHFVVNFEVGCLPFGYK
jgi:hypothetical protein